MHSEKSKKGIITAIICAAFCAALAIVMFLLSNNYQSMAEQLKSGFHAFTANGQAAIQTYESSAKTFKITGILLLVILIPLSVFLGYSMRTSFVNITENGINGKDGNAKKFNYGYGSISAVAYKKEKLIIRATDGKRQVVHSVYCQNASALSDEINKRIGK